MILAQGEAFGSSPEKCGSSGSLLDVTLTFGVTFPNACMAWGLSHYIVTLRLILAVSSLTYRGV